MTASVKPATSARRRPRQRRRDAVRWNENWTPCSRGLASWKVNSTLATRPGPGCRRAAVPVPSRIRASAQSCPCSARCHSHWISAARCAGRRNKQNRLTAFGSGCSSRARTQSLKRWRRARCLLGGLFRLVSHCLARCPWITTRAPGDFLWRFLFLASEPEAEAPRPLDTGNKTLLTGIVI